MDNGPGNQIRRWIFRQITVVLKLRHRIPRSSPKQLFMKGTAVLISEEQTLNLLVLINVLDENQTHAQTLKMKKLGRLA